jgi:peptidoglycan/xylan/chitin deacetylase (PgdA/CDA1 family)
MRSAAAPLAKRAMLQLGAFTALRRLVPNRGLAILRYHAICGADGYDYADPQICISPENFEQHVAYLTSRYRVVRLEDAVAALLDGTLPPNAVAITFDDGYADNLAAARTLAKHGATATFYITAGALAGGEPFWPAELRYFMRVLRGDRLRLDAGGERFDFDVSTDATREVALRRLTKIFKSRVIPVREELRRQLRAQCGVDRGRRVMLTWDEVREMHALGMTIGSHTMTHPNLPSAGLDAAREELRAARQRLEAEIDAPVTMFSYPNGGAETYVTPELKAIVRESGYAAAATSKNAFAGPHSDVYALERIEVEESLQDLIFALEVERFAFKPAPRAHQTSA